MGTPGKVADEAEDKAGGTAMPIPAGHEHPQG